MAIQMFTLGLTLGCSTTICLGSVLWFFLTRDRRPGMFRPIR